MAPRQSQAVGWKRTGRKAPASRKSPRTRSGWVRIQSTDLGLLFMFGFEFPGFLQEGGDEVLLLHRPDQLALAIDAALAGASRHAQVRLPGLPGAVHHATHDRVGDVLVVDLLEA